MQSKFFHEKLLKAMHRGESVPFFESRTWSHPEVPEDLARLRREAPLVHCITNGVVTNFTANVLLALGASPAMVETIEEVADFVRIAQVLLINVGTITTRDAEAMFEAAAAARETDTPWVLDPVAFGALEFRSRIVRELIAFRPAVIRGNASEILALGGETGGAKGVDATVSSTEAVQAAVALAAGSGAVVALSGEIDYITDGSSVIPVPGGHEMMTKVTGMGCTLGALIAALLPVTGSAFRAATAASAIYAEAGERAGRDARGTGSFAVSFLDQLSTIGTEAAP
ncbi:MAG: hydroxyethylthiazole kinase [Chlorobium sp.]|nr:hydroxyethylthiazole kinase [Chlorobium sp.]MCF8383523.1 hydroxyethylthiazole kinase [Chlorobium sp.]